jgi:serine/threonine protein kinase
MGGCSNDFALQNISRQMLKGVEFLHSLRLIHRDIKPSNALISSSGTVLYSAVLCGRVHAALCGRVQCDIVQYCTVECNTVQCSK